MSTARQDPCFYVNESNWERVWHEDGNTRYVVRNGEMRLPYKGEVIRYTDDLERIGVRTDKELEMLLFSGREFWDNPWFEVWDTEDLGLEVVFDTLDLAVAYAQGE